MSADVPIPHPFQPTDAYGSPTGAQCGACFALPSDPTFTEHHAMPQTGPAADRSPFVDPPTFTDDEAAAAFDAAILPAHLAAKRSGL